MAILHLMEQRFWGRMTRQGLQRFSKLFGLYKKTPFHMVMFSLSSLAVKNLVYRALGHLIHLFSRQNTDMHSIAMEMSVILSYRHRPRLKFLLQLKERQRMLD